MADEPRSDARRPTRPTSSSDSGQSAVEIYGAAEIRTYVVDRVECSMVVLVPDTQGPTFDIEAKALPKDCGHEGAVLRVPLGAGGVPEWARTTRDRDEEVRRRVTLTRRLEQFRKTDPGGDVTL